MTLRLDNSKINPPITRTELLDLEEWSHRVSENSITAECKERYNRLYQLLHALTYVETVE